MKSIFFVANWMTHLGRTQTCKPMRGNVDSGIDVGGIPGYPSNILSAERGRAKGGENAMVAVLTLEKECQEAAGWGDGGGSILMLRGLRMMAV